MIVAFVPNDIGVRESDKSQLLSLKGESSIDVSNQDLSEMTQDDWLTVAANNSELESLIANNSRLKAFPFKKTEEVYDGDWKDEDEDER